MPTGFQKRVEEFVCAICSTVVKGTGYTNHCPSCLWSQHVDEAPGDRLAKCGGMMEPIGVELVGGKYVILHRCVQCGFERKNKVAPNDNFDTILKVVRKNVERHQFNRPNAKRHKKVQK